MSNNLRYSDTVKPGALKNTSPLVSFTKIPPDSWQVALKEIVSGILSPRFGVPPSTANTKYWYVHSIVLLLQINSVPFLIAYLVASIRGLRNNREGSYHQ